MSTPRFKKDKEIIADYESQVKGERGRAFSAASCLLVSAGNRTKLVHPELGPSIQCIQKKLATSSVLALQGEMNP